MLYSFTPILPYFRSESYIHERQCSNIDYVFDTNTMKDIGYCVIFNLLDDFVLVVLPSYIKSC